MNHRVVFNGLEYRIQHKERFLWWTIWFISDNAYATKEEAEMICKALERKYPEKKGKYKPIS